MGTKENSKSIMIAPDIMPEKWAERLTDEFLVSESMESYTAIEWGWILKRSDQTDNEHSHNDLKF